ncbi:angiogenic factor with G patch and FHA domains 1 [Copidosoma floridanum]|uniref:angiogenic factor with G patch and FHA domains 1 n=1 Tax=Copidosoma floridanum TaxID=29053 RepID=UPI0006C964AC|nr:angiogenic factor with G patch and FHA domains 1 [Copidosoma floridanum]
MEESSNDADTKIVEVHDYSAELADYPHIIEYIKKLEEKSKCQHDIIQDLKKKLDNHEKEDRSFKSNFVDTGTQTNMPDCSIKPVSQEWVIGDEKEAKSILEQVTQVAESAVLQTGFVYDHTTGLYYHRDTGYYYDPNSKLYYNGNTRTYYYYDEESKSYKFYSQLPENSSDLVNKVRKKKKIKKAKKKIEVIAFLSYAFVYLNLCKSLQKITKKTKLSSEENSGSESEKHKCSDDDSEEEGQLPTSSSEDESYEDSYSSSNSDCETKKDEDLAKTYPPCMRVIVKETNLTNLKVGYLFIVTYMGGSIGREGDHSIIIPDINVSKHHAKLQYNDSKKVYEIIDLGSRNGTLLNGKRLSVAKNESEPSEIVHGSIIQLDQTKLLCHIHNGNDTCGHCEPGLLQLESVVEQNSVSLKTQYKKELKRLKSKFGIEGDNIKKASTLAVGYQDRALSRRETVGSYNDDSKIQQSSLYELISKDNMGFKMLLKMGWKEGKSLGKNGVGITEPVPLHSNVDGAELSASNQINRINVDSNTKKRRAIQKKTQQRFKESCL